MGSIFGGRSTEHEVSTVSATTVLSAIDPARYTPVLIGVANDGGWYVAETESSLLPEAVFGHPDAERVEPVLGDRLRFLDASDQRLGRRRDVIFPIVHGRGGEDGSLPDAAGAAVLAEAVRKSARTTHGLCVLVGPGATPSEGLVFIGLSRAGETTLTRAACSVGGPERGRGGGSEMGLDCVRRLLSGLSIDDPVDFEKQT